MNFQKFQLKRQILKHFTSPKQRFAGKKLFSPTTDKTFLCLWNKNIRADIYRNIQKFAFQILWECTSWASRNCAVQMFILTPTQSIILLRRGSIFFIMLNELRFPKWVRDFQWKWNCIVKWMIFFASFCWLWGFLRENLKVIDKIYHFFSGSNLVFGAVLGYFSQCNFKTFCRRLTIVADVFTQPRPPPHPHPPIWKSFLGPCNRITWKLYKEIYDVNYV